MYVFISTSNYFGLIKKSKYNIHLYLLLLYFCLYTNFLIMQLYVVKVSIEKKIQIT